MFGEFFSKWLMPINSINNDDYQRGYFIGHEEGYKKGKESILLDLEARPYIYMELLTKKKNKKEGGNDDEKSTNVSSSGLHD